MRIYQQILACGLFFITISCQEQAIDQQAEAQKLMELSREWAITAQKDDLQKTLDYWDKDAILMSPGEPALKGHEEIWKKQEDGTWKNAVDIYNSDPSITSIK